MATLGPGLLCFQQRYLCTSSFHSDADEILFEAGHNLYLPYYIHCSVTSFSFLTTYSFICFSSLWKLSGESSRFLNTVFWACEWNLPLKGFNCQRHMERMLGSTLTHCFSHVVKTNYPWERQTGHLENPAGLCWERGSRMGPPWVDRAEPLAACWAFHTYFGQGIMGAEKCKLSPLNLCSLWKQRLRKAHTCFYFTKKKKKRKSETHFSSFNQHF